MSSWKKAPGHSAEVDAVYKDIQELLISTPGHAQHFADKLTEARALSDEPWLDSKYNDRYLYTQDVLSHLPSPETVRILGKMLESDEDVKTQEEVIRLWKIQSQHGGGRYSPYPKSLAAIALHTLGVRDLPPSERAQPQNPPPLPPGSGDPYWKTSHKWWKPQLKWWGEVKSGQRTFSFKGQAVEYRFKPDGTWDTIPIANPPDDAPEVPEARPASERPVTQKAQEPLLGNARKAFRPYLLVALAGLLALAASWFGLRRMKAGK